MNLNFVAGVAATAALFMPVLLILAGRLFTNGSLLTLLFYYLLSGLYNLMALDIFKLPAPVKQQAAVIFNYLDTPMMLTVLLFFCNEKWKHRMLLRILAGFLVFEIGVGFLFGLDAKSSVFLLGPGTFILSILSIYFFSYYGKTTIVQGKSTGKTLMLVSILFSYGCFLIIYYLYYLLRTPAVADVFLIYYIVTFISAMLMSLGLGWIVKRSCEIKERQTTRKELALFFDN